MTAQRVDASAISDTIGPGRWRITVTGQPPFACTRTYDISAATEDDAARKGLDWFVNEMRELDS